MDVKVKLKEYRLFRGCIAAFSFALVLLTLRRGLNGAAYI